VDPVDPGQTKQPDFQTPSLAAASAVGATNDGLRLKVSLEGVPEPVTSLLQNLAKPRSGSRLRGIVKDYSSLLTPILTALIAALVAFFGYEFDDHVSRDTLDKITTEFVRGNDDPNVTAMKLASYGEKALPAVRMALGIQDPKLRNGAVKIAAQMYFTETVGRDRLTKSMLKYYDNPVLRLGVLEWFSTIEGSQIPLSAPQREAVFEKMQKTFGSAGEKCEDQGPEMAGAVADLLLTGPLANRKSFVLGMEQHCPKTFDAVHRTIRDALESK
jgi:hypothetical protein